MTRTSLAAFVAAIVAIMSAGACSFGTEPPSDIAPADAWRTARGCLAGTGRSSTTLALPLTEAWRRDFEKASFAAVPVIADGIIYVGDLDGHFHALNLASGKSVWTFETKDAGFPSSAALGDDPLLPLVVGDDMGVVRGLDRQTGEVCWEYATDGEISGGPTILPTADGPKALVGSQDASLSCLDLATGQLIWKHSIADQIRCGPTVARRADGDRVFLAGCDGRLHVIDAATGEEKASVEIGGPTGTTPAAAGDRTFFGTEGGGFFAIDFTTPAVAWRHQPAAGGQAYRSSAAVADGLVIVGTRGRAVEAFAAADGHQVWRRPMPGRVDASPVVVTATGSDADPDMPARAVVLVADAKGTIAAMELASGEPAWQFEAGGSFAAGPAVASGRAVLVSEDGTIWCFQP
jgi:outer membrane protein assembly factor BamB